MAIRILIAEEHGVLRSALRALLEKRSDFEIVGEICRPEETSEILERLDAEVLLLDCGMFRRCESDYNQSLISYAPNLAMVVLGLCEDDCCVQRLFRSGVRGYVLKTSPEEELLNALFAVCRGEYYVDSSIAGCIEVPKKTPQGEEAGLPLSLLTAREQEVCKLLAYGYTNAEVAEKLNVSGRTVEAHRSKIMTKLRLNSRADLVRFALANGLLRATSNT